MKTKSSLLDAKLNSLQMPKVGTNWAKRYQHWIEMKKLFSASDTLVQANNGFATLVRTLADTALGVDGSIAARSEGLRDRISANEKRQAALEVRVSQTEARLRKQYTALDTKMGELQSLSSYVSQQVALLNSGK